MPASTAPEALMLDIAKRHFLVETLDTRNSDGLDFHDRGQSNEKVSRTAALHC